MAGKRETSRKLPAAIYMQIQDEYYQRFPSRVHQPPIHVPNNQCHVTLHTLFNMPTFPHKNQRKTITIMMVKSFSFSLCLVLSAFFLVPFPPYFLHAIATTALGGRGGTVPVSDGPTVRKNERWSLVSSEFGEISAVKISDARNGCYDLQFITVDPHSVFLPVYLYSEMVLYVNSGNGTLSWIEVGKDAYKLQQLKLQMGDIYTLQAQTVFYLQNNLEANNPQELQIYAIYTDSGNQLSNRQCADQVYTGIHDLVQGFDNKVLQATLSVSEEVINELRVGEKQPLIVEDRPEANNSMLEVGSQLIKTFLGTNNYDIFDLENKKKKKKDKKKKVKKEKEKKDKKEGKTEKKEEKKDKKEGKPEKKEEKKRAYNVFNADHDVENSYGWSVTVSNEQLDTLQDSDFSVFMVNLTKGSMMGPHWNPTSAEIAIVLQGQGMIQVVCPRLTSETVCKNSRFKVEEGDVFMVPRYHPISQMSYNNKSFVFMGFTMKSENNPSEYLAGKNSILQTLDKKVLAQSLDVRNTTVMDEIMSAKNETIFLECTSCAEEEERLMEEEAEREREGYREEQQEAVIEGEIARREEDVLRRRLRKAEAATEARRREAEGKDGGKEKKVDEAI